MNARAITIKYDTPNVAVAVLQKDVWIINSISHHLPHKSVKCSNIWTVKTRKHKFNNYNNFFSWCDLSHRYIPLGDNILMSKWRIYLNNNRPCRFLQRIRSFQQDNNSTFVERDEGKRAIMRKEEITKNLLFRPNIKEQMFQRNSFHITK